SRHHYPSVGLSFPARTSLRKKLNAGCKPGTGCRPVAAASLIVILSGAKKLKNQSEMFRGACPERSRRAQHDRGNPNECFTANPSAHSLALLRQSEHRRRSVAPASRCEQTLRPEENENLVAQAQGRRARQWSA